MQAVWKAAMSHPFSEDLSNEAKGVCSVSWGEGVPVAGPIHRTL